MERGVNAISAAVSPTRSIAEVAAVLNEAKKSDVCYCVDGAVCEDEACKIILSAHKDCELQAAKTFALFRARDYFLRIVKRRLCSQR